MVVVYLLVPLLWLDGFAAGHDGGRLVLSRSSASPGPSCSPPSGGTGWPSGACSPRAAGLDHRGLVRGGRGSGADPPAPARAGRGPARRAGGQARGGAALSLVPERRFELPTLRRVWPLLVAYLVLSALWPMPWPPMRWTLGPWHGGWGIVDLADMPGVTPMLRALEYLAAFTLLGYSVAESRGRLEESTGRGWLGWLARAFSPPPRSRRSAASIPAMAPACSSSSSPRP